MIYLKKDEIKSRRLQLKLSQRQLSKKAGLPANAINRIERGTSSYIHPIRARAIATALGCKMAEIFEIK